MTTNSRKPPLNELAHYGVLGMKWGVRKDRNSESYTNVNSTKKLSTGQKVAIGAAATALVIGGAYGVYKLSNTRALDRNIKVGRDLFRQGHKNESVKGLNEIVYASFKKTDIKKYKELLPGSTSYKIHSSKNIKVAGTKNAEKLYKELLKTDNIFASRYGKSSYEEFNGMIGYANKLMIENNHLFKESYMSPFFKSLADKGYDAVVDTQDHFAKIPVMLINASNTFKIIGRG